MELRMAIYQGNRPFRTLGKTIQCETLTHLLYGTTGPITTPSMNAWNCKRLVRGRPSKCQRWRVNGENRGPHRKNKQRNRANRGGLHPRCTYAVVQSRNNAWEKSTMSESDWRSPEAYAIMQDAEAADFAWEFLRRNPEYRDDHRKLQLGGSLLALHWKFRRRWGLSFRG
jgi:hypothetical protein